MRIRTTRTNLLHIWLKSTTALVGVLPIIGFGATLAHANPQGGTVVQGAATISQPDAKTVQVNQSSNRAVIDWKSFSIAAGETTRFIQPSSSSMTLNRVTGDQVSQILGSLQANGRIFLVNPNGIVFGSGSKIDVAALVASTANIKNENFMAGNLRFDIPGKANAQIINQGTISVADGGLAALVAPSMRNSGIISARLGKVALVAANGVTLDLYGDNLILFQASDKITRQVVGADGQPVSALVQNDGKIYADGGSVFMTANVAKGVVDSIINMTGIVQARAVEQQGGDIVLKGEDGGIVRVAGTLDASGKDAGQRGGSVSVLGEKVGLFDQARVDVSGDAGGGKALIGGDYMGGNGDAVTIARNSIIMEAKALPTSQFAFMADTASIYADAITSGKGGKVIVWADEATRAYGSIFARGGANGGDGGFVETSGKNFLDVGRAPDASAAKGKAGTWLLDPRNVVISTLTSNGSFDGASPNIFTPSADDAVVNRDTIQTALDSGTSVQVSTGTTGTQTGTIAIAADIIKSAGGNATLALYAAGNIYTSGIRSIRSTSGKLNIVMSSSAAVSLGWQASNTTTLTTNRLRKKASV